MQVVMKVSGQEPPLLPGEAVALAGAAGTTLAAQHPSTRDPELARWYVAELADPVAAERLASALRGAEGVEAAYVKPGAEPASAGPAP